ncbi:MAG: preprotein translocase subunit SecG [Acidobacteriota bacterium]|nr:preprotein translocase subunit SecG [Acidobacteriota bacterium]
MEGFVLFLLIVVSLLLNVVVLLQSGKSADLAGAFGGAGSQSTFGPRGSATFLSKLTTVLAVLFMVLTLLLMIISSRKSATRSVLGPDQAPPAAAQTTTEQKNPPAAPAQEQPLPQPAEGQEDSND